MFKYCNKFRKPRWLLKNKRTWDASHIQCQFASDSVIYQVNPKPTLHHDFKLLICFGCQFRWLHVKWTKGSLHIPLSICYMNQIFTNCNWSIYSHIKMESSTVVTVSSNQHHLMCEDKPSFGQHHLWMEERSVDFFFLYWNICLHWNRPS